MPNKTYNTRAPAMWEIISSHVDVRDKDVIDYGFGHGDLLLYAAEAGAAACKGMDKDCDLVRQLRSRQDEFPQVYWAIVCHDMEWYVDKYCMFFGEIAFCCSVLPYLRDPFHFLENLYYTQYEATFIECQYAGDGPGLPYIENDWQMESLLREVGWNNPVPIGKTLVEERNRHRTIWKCER